MSLTRLRTFVEVYRQGSITAAALRLSLTQPAVSQHIAGLESALGRRLFVRERHGVRPTAAADELAADVGDRLDAAESALASAKARSVELAGALQVVGHADFLAEVVAAELAPLLQRGVRVRLQAGDRDRIQQLLVDGDCELGLSAYAVTDPRLCCELIRSEPTAAVAAPVVARRVLAATDLKSALLAEPVLAYSLELPIIEDWLARNGLALHPLLPALIGQDLRSLRSLLVAGFGWSVLPAYLCRAAIATGALAEIPAPVAATELNYYLIWAPSALRQPRVAHARETLLQRLRSS
ncbi:LysR family transcriptional regulator [uncultured Aquincola sp.]|uniref:LysR family transcriptional regulator n=1 Tax=uncultured Aquincola sp. TaxID=886556 RepID=UPI0032B3057F